MIIKKSMFKYSRKYRGKWPFNVDEVAVLMMEVRSTPQDVNGPVYKAFAIVHNFGAFALSGLLESHGFPKMEEAGIWVKGKSLSPFFEFLKNKVE